MNQVGFLEVLRSHGITEPLDLSPPSSRAVQGDGVNINVLDWGGNGPDILFLHGGGQNARTWDLVCVQLRSRLHCYAMDLRNHGASGDSSDWLDPAVHARDIGAAIRNLGLSNPILVGMSLGGLSTIAYAASGGHLRAAVIVDVTPTITRDRRENTYRFIAQDRFDSFEDAVEAAVRINPHRPRVHHRYSLTHMLEQQGDGTWKRRSRGGMRRMQEGTRKTGASVEATHATFERLWDVVPDIPVPVLVVHGMESDATDAADAERLARSVQRGRVVHVPGATHTVQGDKPLQLAREVLQFALKPEAS